MTMQFSSQPSQPDFIIIEEGRICLISPNNDEAAAFLDSNATADLLRVGDAVAVKRRDVYDFCRLLRLHNRSFHLAA